jgi:hypothetical protein
VFAAYFGLELVFEDIEEDEDYGHYPYAYGKVLGIRTLRAFSLPELTHVCRLQGKHR